VATTNNPKGLNQYTSKKAPEKAGGFFSKPSKSKSAFFKVMDDAADTRTRKDAVTRATDELASAKKGKARENANETLRMAKRAQSSKVTK
jgi:hypothetical protein